MADIEFAAYLSDSASRRVLTEADPTIVVRRGSIRQALRAFEDGRSPDTLLVDLDGEPNPIPQVNSLLQVCRPETTILAAGSENSVTLANELYRGGIFLYLPKPLDANSLRNALSEILEVGQDQQDSAEIRASHVLLMHGKGMGVNTATALFAHVAAGLGRYVSCLDLDANFGSLALALDVEPERGLAQVLRNPERLNASAIEALQVRVTNRIGLLAFPFDHIEQEGAAYHGLEPLIRELASHAHLILVCGAPMDQVWAMHRYVTNHAVVFEPTPTGVSIASRWLRLLKSDQSALVMNHARQLPKLIGREQLRSAFGNRLPDLEIPYIRGMAEEMMLGNVAHSLSARERKPIAQFMQSLLGLGSVDLED